MQLKKFNDDGRQVIWDASSLQVYASCKKKYEYRIDIGYQVLRENKDTGFGKLVHFVSEMLHVAKFNSSSKDEAVISTIKSCLKDYSGYLSYTDNAKNLKSFMRLVVWYAEYLWEREGVLARMPDGKPALEVRFEVPFPYKDYRFSGRIDKLIYESYDDMYPTDVKTTTQPLRTNFAYSYFPSFQTISYMWALREMGFNPKGFMIEGIQLLVDNTRFIRSKAFIEDNVIDEWLKQAIELVKDYDDRFTNKKVFDRNFDSCQDYRGCDYRGVCTAKEENRKYILESDFKKEKYLGSSFSGI